VSSDYAPGRPTDRRVRVAQWIARLPPKQKVAGSNPASDERSRGGPSKSCSFFCWRGGNSLSRTPRVSFLHHAGKRGEENEKGGGGRKVHCSINPRPDRRRSIRARLTQSVE
jgi:hypothetical protein